VFFSSQLFGIKQVKIIYNLPGNKPKNELIRYMSGIEHMYP